MTASLIKIASVVLTASSIELNIAKATTIQEQYYYENPVLEIPKIDLKQETYPNDPDKNNVDKNIEVIEGSSTPDEKLGNFILASHSGSSSISYFKHLDQLNSNDEVYVYYKNYKYKYIIDDIYDVAKTGYVSIKRAQNKSAITLITCKKGTNMQTVYIGYLVTAKKIP